MDPQVGSQVPSLKESPYASTFLPLPNAHKHTHTHTHPNGDKWEPAPVAAPSMAINPCFPNETLSSLSGWSNDSERAQHSWELQVRGLFSPSIPPPLCPSRPFVPPPPYTFHSACMSSHPFKLTSMNVIYRPLFSQHRFPSKCSASSPSSPADAVGQLYSQVELRAGT